MAVALEELTPEAQAAAARLHPGVKAYLEAKAGKQAAEAAEKAAAGKAKASREQGGRASASRTQEGSGSDALAETARFERRLDAITPGGGLKRSSAGSRLITAAFIGVFVLEALSYMLGQPFSYNLKGAGQKIGNLSKTPYVPLYSGQGADLARLRAQGSAPLQGVGL